MKKNVSVPSSNAGFTLIELLVVIGLLSILTAVGTETVVSLIRSNTKTNTINEAKQNGQLVIDTFEKDIRSAKSISPVPGLSGSSVSSSSINITTITDDIIVYSCVNGGGGSNDYISRKGVSMTNTDKDNGVNISFSTCSFKIALSSGVKVINFNFTLTEPKNRTVIAGGRAEYKVEIPFGTTLTLRNE